MSTTGIPSDDALRTWPEVIAECRRRHGWKLTRQNCQRIGDVALKKLALAWQAGRPSAWMLGNGAAGGRDATGADGKATNKARAG